MEPLPIAFLWHHHQPYYKDPLTGVYSLPWVRLHAVKGYYDMAAVLKDFPRVHGCFNMVPSLVRQLQEYQDGTAEDRFLDLTLKPAESLAPDEKLFILRYFFMANPETMIRPIPRYHELFQQRGAPAEAGDLDRAAARFSAGDLRDLQLLFNLAWFGFKALEEQPSLRELRRKGRAYTEADKAEVVRCQREVLRRVIPLHRQLESAGQIELTTSPYYHPILPLVYDTDIARRCMPNAVLPEEPFRAPEDARAQIERAVALHARVFGRPPRGVWPSEGSVAPEIIPLLVDAGVRWIATDEEILLQSLPTRSRGEALYRPYRVEVEGRGLTLVFRSQELSNLFSFTWSRMDPRSAVDQFFDRIEAIREDTRAARGPSLVTIVLDGENPWEYYPESGRHFLTELYSRLSAAEAVRTVRIGDELERNSPQQVIPRLWSGSWIHHDFDIWIGSEEENLAWEYLRRARRTLLPHLQNAEGPAERREAAWDAIYAAEGSDWFWWYGDDFSSSHDEEFDRLFRGHLLSAFRRLGLEGPDYLSQSILHPHPVKHATVPVNFIRPVLDGRRTDYFEWLGAGCYDATRRSTRFGSRRLISAIYYGFDPERCYLRLDPAAGCGLEERKRYEIHVRFLGGPDGFRWVIACALDRPPSFSVERGVDDIRYERVASLDSLAMGQILELAVPFELMGWKAGDRRHFIVEIREGGSAVETYPPNGYLVLEVPDRDFEQIMWSV